MLLLALWNVGKFKKLRAEKFQQLSNKETTVTMMKKTDKFFYSELDGKVNLNDNRVEIFKEGVGGSCHQIV